MFMKLVLAVVINLVSVVFSSNDLVKLPSGEIIPPFGKDNLNYVNLTEHPGHLRKRASCDDYHACVQFGYNGDCISEESNYIPNCAGNCYQ